VVLVWLDVVEVWTFTAIETIVTVKLEKTILDWVTSTIDQETEVVALVNTDIVIAVSTSIDEFFNWERKITDGEISLNVGALDVAVLINMDISVDEVGKDPAWVRADAER